MRRAFGLIAVLLVACGSEPLPTLVEYVTATPLPTVTAAPTLTASAWPTAPAIVTWTPTATFAPTSTQLPSETPLPTVTVDPVSCGDLDAAWSAAAWDMALVVLDRLQTAGLTCGDATLDSKRYAAHVNYAITLEQASDEAGAIAQYQAALRAKGQGIEAIRALIRLKALPQPTEPVCDLAQPEPYTPSWQSFVTASGSQFVTDSGPFMVRGVNYYPRHAPWDRFLPQANLDEVAEELDLIAGAGFNTIRIFLWYDPLFSCAPEGAIPNVAAFARLDKIMALAIERNLRLIVTLNDLPDLLFRPLYTDYARYDAQTTFIVNRYRNEPAILAWDLRNEGDIDYTPPASLAQQSFTPEMVLNWLAHTAQLVRAADSNHLITAGWWGDTQATAKTVDVLSFHYWADSTLLAKRIDDLITGNNKPVLLEEVGYSSAATDEKRQAQSLQKAIATAERAGVAGWLVWTAFDFTPLSGQPLNAEHAFGLWHTDLSPKPALGVLPLTPTP